MKGFTFTNLLIALAIAAIVATMCISCTSESDARKALRASGFTEIEITGHKFFVCDEKDTFSTGFCAKNPRGVRVCGVVCSGWLKGGTIRFD